MAGHARGQRPSGDATSSRVLLERLERLSRFSQEAIAAPDDVGVFRLAVQAAREVIDAAHVSVLAIDRDRGVFRVAASAGLDPETQERFELPTDRGVAGLALARGEPVMVSVVDDPSFLRFEWQKERFHTLLCVPMRVWDEAIGVISIGSVGDDFTDSERLLGTVLANLTAAAVESTRLLAQGRRNLKRLSAVLEAARSIQSMVTLSETLDRIVQDAVSVTSGGECGTLMLAGKDGRLEVRAQVGYGPGLLDSLRLGPDEGYAGHVLKERRATVFHALSASPLRAALERQLPPESAPLRVKSAVGVPVMLANRVLGVLGVESLTDEWGFSDEDAEILTGLASHAAIALERARLYEQRRELYLSGIRTLVAAIDARDPSARGHSDRVAFLCRRIAEAMRMASVELEQVELAALLHDVGKIGIADSVLRKPGPLEPAERAVMMAHVELGAQILGANHSLRDLVPLVRHHHEWYGGGGYPDGLTGERIPIGACIISVADAFDTMTTGRPYRAASTVEDALAELDRCSGTQFHPNVVQALRQVLAEDEAKGAAYVFQLRGWFRESGDGPSERPRSPAENEEAQATSGTQATLAVPELPIARELEGGRVVPMPQERAGRISPVQTKELATLYRMAQALRDVLDLSIFLQKVLDIVATELDLHDACVFLVDPETDELVMAAASGAFAGLEGIRLKKDQGVNGWVASRGQPVLVPDVSQEPRYFPGPATTRSEVVVPLSAGGRVIGTLTVDSPRLNAFSVEDVQLLTGIAQKAGSGVEVAQLHEQVRRAALRDGLTDLFNHRHFYERLEEEIERAGRYGYGVQVLLGDVDRLKDVNDNLGHLAGDGVLRELARVLRSNSRRYDVLARYGGDEFAVIMPQSDRQGALTAIERFSRAIAEASFDWYGVKLDLPHISWGVASFPEDGQRSSELVAAADGRMYVAKREARSTVTQEPPAGVAPP